MKTLIVGDIHGCYLEFQELLARSGIAESDEIIALGDIVDRGPETPQVLDFFRQQPNAFSLMGNHERKHVRAARGEVKRALSQTITREQIDVAFGDPAESVKGNKRGSSLSAAYHDALAFMETFPIFVELPEAILVHGYLEPGIPLEQQLPTVLCGTMGGDRHMSAHYDRPWYELYTGEKPVVVGHHDHLRNGQAFVYQERIFGLDTSCVHGKTLTGLVLPDFNILSVPSRGDLWYFTRKQYRQKHPVVRSAQPKPVEAFPWDEESEQILQAILDLAIQENERINARLHEQPDFENLTPRQQAKVYAAKIGETPLAMYMHMARRGELDHARAKKALRQQGQALELAKQVGIK